MYIDYGNYYVYFGSAYSNAKGTASSWLNWGNVSFETHSNDGATLSLCSGLIGGTLLLTTDQGLGWTKNSGSIISEINDGIEAVQVNDFDINVIYLMLNKCNMLALTKSINLNYN